MATQNKGETEKKAVLKQLKAKMREVTALEKKLDKKAGKPIDTQHLIEEIQVPTLQALKDKK